MRTNIFKSIILVLLSIGLTTMAFSAKKHGDFSKPNKKVFNINKGALLDIDCEFTDIKAFNWDKDQISVEVIITVDAKNEEKANDKFDRVHVKLSGTSDVVNIKTSLSNDYFGNHNNNIDIEVLIYYPEYIQLKLENEFGNSLFENINESVDVDISYGNFTAGNLISNELDLKAEFGKIEVIRFQAGDAHVSYGEFAAQIVGDLRLESEFSSNEIDYAEKVNVHSAYDKIYFRKLNSGRIEQEFTNLRINKLTKNLKMTTSYGSFKLDNIAIDFETIDIESEFTGLILYLNTNTSFGFQVSSDMGSFKYPKDLATVTKYQKEMFELEIEGYFGNTEDPKSQLILNLENASASIKIND